MKSNMGSAAVRRLQKELKEVKESKLPYFRDVTVIDDNVLLWRGLVLPEKAPYNKGAFKIEVAFPQEYPFKPPKITFVTQIYHPNVDEKGQVCLPIIASENWKPATRAIQVIEALVGLVNDPEPSHPLRADLAKQFTVEKKKFLNAAESHTKQHSEKRPT